MSDYILDHVGHYDHTEAQRQEYAAIVERRIRAKSAVLRQLNPTLVETLTSELRRCTIVAPISSASRRVRRFTNITRHCNIALIRHTSSLSPRTMRPSWNG